MDGREVEVGIEVDVERDIRVGEQAARKKMSRVNVRNFFIDAP